MSSQRLGRVVQVNVNPRGGVAQHAIDSTEVTTVGVAGDKQRDRRFHGGPQRAVSLFSMERIEGLRAEGHPIGPGTTGENLTLAGIDWDQIKVGDRLRVGEWVELEITGYASPCSNIEESFAGGSFKRMSQKLHPGWSRLYAKVLAEGTVRAGDSVEHVAA
jgi:MOSC domain-containing protein YiiM